MGGIPGDRAAVQAELARFAEAGVGRFVLALGTLTPADYEETSRTHRHIIRLGHIRR